MCSKPGVATVRTAFDHGITHLDLANNYGPPYGSAEETLGRILHLDLSPYRDELIISTKAGFDMVAWDPMAILARGNTSLPASIKASNAWE